MKPTRCPHEEAVTRAARRDHWEDFLRSHALKCVICREAVEVVQSLRSLAEGAETDCTLPEAELLWSNALLAEKQVALERARKWLALTQAAPLLLVVLAFAGWFAWNWSEIQPLPAGFLGVLPPQVWRAVESVPYLGLALFWLIGAVILALVVILFAHPLLAED